jgi:signal transduction histidine kinase
MAEMNTSLTLLGAVVAPSSEATRAHAIKNCLAVVHAVQTLLEPHLTGDARDRLRRAQDAVRRMRAILDEDLVASSSATERRFCLATDVVRTVVRRVEDRAEAGAVHLVVHSGPGGLCGYRDELVEAFCNVVLNAIEVTPAGGQVSVATYEGHDGAQLWTVRDMGAGIPPEVLPRLGNPCASTKKDGSGLGLAVARSVVARHEGLIRVESSERSGTLVSMWFPPASER